MLGLRNFVFLAIMGIFWLKNKNFMAHARQRGCSPHQKWQHPFAPSSSKCKPPSAPLPAVFNCLRNTEPVRGDSFLLTVKSPGVSGIHLIDYGKMKG